MARILVNDLEQTAEPAPNTWGELLDRLDCASATHGRIVTAARFDGVDEPAFREEPLKASRLEAWNTVEVKTDAPRRLLANCLTEVASGVAAMRTAVVRLAGLFRGADVSMASAGLGHVAADLQTLITLVNTLSGPLGVELGSLRSGDRTVADHMQTLEQHLEAIVQAQTDHDWLTVADVLEYDLEPSLGGWEQIFAALASFVPADTGSIQATS